MTIYGTTDGAVVGQPTSPNFGAQNGAGRPGGAVIELPAGMPLMVAMSLGLVPINALVNTINGVSPGGNPAVIGSDPVTIAQLCSNGNGSETGRGASIAANGAINNQIFADGYGSASQTSNGSVPKNTAALTEAPVTPATLCQNVVLFANQFGG